MKTLAYSLLLLISTSAFAQSATLASPDQPPARDHIKVGRFVVESADPTSTTALPVAHVTLWLMTPSETIADYWVVDLQGSEVGGLVKALRDPAPGEVASTANNAGRVENYRVLNYLKANCANFVSPCPSAVTTVTLVP